MEKAYAAALWKLVKSGTDPKEAAAKIRDALTRRGRASLLPAVSRALQRLAWREAQKNRSVLVVARKADEERARTESGAKTADMEVDHSLIGGWRFFHKGEMRDASWKTALLHIYQNATR